MVVVGDSHTAMWVPALTFFGSEHHYAVVPLIKDGCTAGTWLQDVSGDSCRRWDLWARQEIRQLHPAAIVIGESYSGLVLSQATSDWAETGLAREIIALRQLSPRVVLIEDVPRLPKNPTDCLLANGATLGSCTFALGGELASADSTINYIAHADRAKFLRTLQWFCAGGKCPTVVGTTIAYWDQEHVTATYATQLRAPFAEQLASLLQ